MAATPLPSCTAAPASYEAQEEGRGQKDSVALGPSSLQALGTEPEKQGQAARRRGEEEEVKGIRGEVWGSSRSRRREHGARPSALRCH